MSQITPMQVVQDYLTHSWYVQELHITESDKYVEYILS